MIPTKRSKTLPADSGIAYKVRRVDQKSGVLATSFLSGRGPRMQSAKPFKIGRADFSMANGSKLEIVCRITGARMNECSYARSEELRTPEWDDSHG